MENLDEQDVKYFIVPEEHKVEALSLLKDWVVVLFTIQMGALAVIADIIQKSDTAAWTLPERGTLVVAIVFFVLSVVAGTFLLNMIPGACQRKSRNTQSGEDIYSIYTLGRLTINFWVNCFRMTFIVSVVALGIFVVLRIF